MSASGTTDEDEAAGGVTAGGRERDLFGDVAAAICDRGWLSGGGDDTARARNQQLAIGGARVSPPNGETQTVIASDYGDVGPGLFVAPEQVTHESTNQTNINALVCETPSARPHRP